MSLRFLVALLLLAAAPALAQAPAPPAPAPAPAPTPAQDGANTNSNLGSGPVTIEADRGIEWRRNENLYEAVGNAKAVRGRVTVTADRLIAHYREAQEGTDIYKVEAIGNVVIATPTERATGERGTYDVDKQVMVLTGRNLKFTTPKQEVTSRDSLEYWETRRVAVARGNAQAVEADRRVAADTLVAHLVEDQRTKNTRIAKVDGWGNLDVATSKEVARSSRGTYNLDTNIAVMIGDVKVSQGRNQLNGDYAEVNMNTGVSKMLSGPAAGVAGRRVRGLIVPEQGRAPSNTAGSGTR